MSLTVIESRAVFDLLRWLADKHTDYIGPKITEADAIAAMEILAAAAGRRLVIPDPMLPALIVERLRAADSDGAAQAVCRALDAERGRRPVGSGSASEQALETWRRVQGAAVEVAR